MKRIFFSYWPTLFWAAVVFVLAILIRLPSCYESFWVDELHTAWAIWGDFADVSPRAAVGNQTPLYFYLMWVWKAVVGESEVMLRMSSVMAVAFGSSLLVFAVRQATQRLSAGVLSGGILAVESNSLFFGTEFRPYAFVMLLSVVATWSTVRLIQLDAGMRGGNLRLILVTAISLAALVHPTSIVTLGLLPVAVLIFAWIDRGVNFKFQISDFVSLILVAAVAFSLANSSLGHSWENRSQWRAFGHASSMHQFWTIWPWLTVAVMPAVAALAMLWRESIRAVATAMLPMIVGLIATGIFFAASYFDWVPLWHRRYFVAVLPMLAWSAGACLAKLPSPVLRDGIDLFGSVFTAALVCVLLWQQGTLAQWQRHQTQLVFRGEDWRGAVTWVNRHRASSDRVIVDAQLIEVLHDGVDPKSETRLLTFLTAWLGYFSYPVSGPYLIDDAKLPFQMREFRNSNRNVQGATFYVSRGQRDTAERSLENQGYEVVESVDFGRVIVLKCRDLGQVMFSSPVR